MALLLGARAVSAAQDYTVRGVVLKVDKSHNTLEVSCDTIPDYMDRMVMSFSAKNPAELNNVGPGAMVEFTLVVDNKSSHIENIHLHRYESVEQDPSSAKRLKFLAAVLDSSSTATELKAGDAVPDFSIADQRNQRVALSQFAGKVVVITFTYTRCVLPQFCFRNSNNFKLLQKRFAKEMGSDLILFTITFDPAHDSPEVMEKYGKTWNANPETWHLLTGSQAEVEKICERFGMSAWANEGLMNHSLYTVIVDRAGKLVANLAGNEYSAQQLGDLVQTVVDSQKERRNTLASLR
jgi:protein SCO1/2